MTLAVLSVAVGMAGVVLPTPSISWPIFGEASNGAPAAGGLHPAAPARALSATPPAAQQAGAVRRIYRHSVVPGGVADKIELAQVLRSDRLVAAHYATFNVDNARAVTVTAPRAVYVSYRKNDQIYWTSKKVMLEQGETLLTDGEHDIRARCANRISDVPQYPVESHGPTEAELDTVFAVAGFSDMAGAMGDDAGMLPVGMDDLTANEAVGQRYYATGFPNGAGLLTLANTTPMPLPTPFHQGEAPGLPGWYNAPIYRGGVLGPASPAGGSEDTGNGVPTPVTDGGEIGIVPESVDVTELPVDTPPSRPTPAAGADTPATPTEPGTPATPTTPAAPVTPTTPATPGTPATPDTPATPAAPDTPTTPGDTPVVPIAPTEVPEPGTLWLGGIALAALLWLRRKGPRAR